MGDSARKLETIDVSQEVGTVVQVTGGRPPTFMVRTSHGTYDARRAVSCLVEPAADDEVLLSCVSTGACYVLAVLEREVGGAIDIVLEGDLGIKLPSGRCTVAAQEGVTLASGEDVSIAAGRFAVKAVDGSVVFERLTLLGSAILAEAAKIKLFAGTLDSVMERLSQKVKRSYRTIEEHDQVRAGHIDYEAKKVMSLRSKNLIATAEGLVKVDGDQIHLG